LDNLLARFAFNAFWMGRYLERAENLARILDVNETFARDRSQEDLWRPILQLHGEAESFMAQHDRCDAREVVFHYTLSRHSPSSVRSCLDGARENARSMRHLISTEMWRHLNVFHEWVCGLKRRDIRLDNLSNVCARIKEGCQTFTGILEGTLHRDQLWYFYQLGKAIERADQTTRLIDIKSQVLTSTGGDAAAIDISQWNAVLRSAAGYHAFRRIHPQGLKGEMVTDFLLLDKAFPRSVAHSVEEIDALLYGMRRYGGLTKASQVRKSINPLIEALQARPTGKALQTKLSGYLDGIQVRLDDLSNEIAATFFH